MNTHTNSKTPIADRVFKKVSVKELEQPENKKGWAFEGTYVCIKRKPYARANTKGELEEKTFAQLILLQNGERVAVACDGGLQEQLNMSDVKEGDYIKCVNMGKKTLTGGRTMNVWDVYIG